MKKGKIFTVLFFGIALFLVQSCDKEPIACFTVTQQEIFYGDTVYFTNCSVNCDIYEWDFEDGEESLDENPTYVFNTDWPMTKEFTITLGAKSKYGVFDYATQKIKVHPIHERFTGTFIGTKTIDGIDEDISVIISNNGFEEDLVITGLFARDVYATATFSTKISIVKNHPMHEQPFSGSGTLTNDKSLHLVIIYTDPISLDSFTVTFVGEMI